MCETEERREVLLRRISHKLVRQGSCYTISVIIILLVLVMFLCCRDSHSLCAIVRDSFCILLSFLGDANCGNLLLITIIFEKEYKTGHLVLIIRYLLLI